MVTEKRVGIEYLAAGANRYTAAADWDHEQDGGFVAYGADSNVALWKPVSRNQPRNGNGVSWLVSGHKDVVKAIKFLPQGRVAPVKPGENRASAYIVSGSDDQHVKVWRLDDRGEDTTCECVATVHAHQGAVNCIATLGEKVSTGPSTTEATGNEGEKTMAWVFSTGSADGTVKIWTFCPETNSLRTLQSIRPKQKFIPLTVAMSQLHHNGDRMSAVMAVAGTRDFVQIYVADSITPATEAAPTEFKLQATLSGHEGWIRSLDFTSDSTNGNGDMILASASQDKYIRLWRFHRGAELPAATQKNPEADPTLGAYLPGRSPSNKAYRLKTSGAEGEGDYSITFEALLLGHDDWIYSAKWFARGGDGTTAPVLNLLSASADNTLAVWEADPSTGIWVTTSRLGEISREKGATTATGSTGGFWTGLWGHGGSAVACLGRTGSWRLWEKSSNGNEDWTPNLALSGHTRTVTGIAWSKDGTYLLSTSADQTTRLHAAWEREIPSSEPNRQEKYRTWHEMARPQIHGYDLNCIDTLGGARFVSGADEKLMRVFDEPRATAKLLRRLNVTTGEGNDEDTKPEAADMPVLGLSNKAVIDGDDDNAEAANQDNSQTAGESATIVASLPKRDAEEAARPPLEDVLSRHTLWPEAEKLYGHGYELSCLACSGDGRLVASACKASSANHAVIRVFATDAATTDDANKKNAWVESQKPPLRAHTLTATRLRFSGDDAWLLSVGRDRTWAVFRRDREEGEGDMAAGKLGLSFTTLQTNPKGHSRMILDAAWAPVSTSSTQSGEEKKMPPASLTSSSSSLPPPFATAGRDKSVKIWRAAAAIEGGGDDITCVTTITETHPVTAVDFLPRTVALRGEGEGEGKGEGQPAAFVLAVGTEAGKVTLYTLNTETLAVVSSIVVPNELCLAKSVLQLAWRPQNRHHHHQQNHDNDGEKKNISGELAIAGEDGSLRIYSFSALGGQ